MIATTEGALDDLRWHRMIRDSGWNGRVVTAYRPDAVVDPDFEGFAANLDTLGEITGCDTGTWARLSRRPPQPPRLSSRRFGATSTDHGHPTADTANLSAGEAGSAVRPGAHRQGRRRRARRSSAAQMLTEMARMSLDDGLVLQIHPGSWRNHSPAMLRRFGRDKGFDIPTRTDYVARAEAAARRGRHASPT